MRVAPFQRRSITILGFFAGCFFVLLGRRFSWSRIRLLRFFIHRGNHCHSSRCHDDSQNERRPYRWFCFFIRLGRHTWPTSLDLRIDGVWRGTTITQYSRRRRRHDPRPDEPHTNIFGHGPTPRRARQNQRQKQNTRRWNAKSCHSISRLLAWMFHRPDSFLPPGHRYRRTTIAFTLPHGNANANASARRDASVPFAMRPILEDRRLAQNGERIGGPRRHSNRIEWRLGY